MFSKGEKIKKYLLIFFILLVIYSIYSVYHILSPFIVSALLIYLLLPFVNYVTNQKFFGKHLSRGQSVILIYFVILSLLTMASIIIFPLLYSEGFKIASELPKQISNFRHETLPTMLINLQQQFDIYGIDINLKRELDKTIGSFLSSGQGFVESIPTYVQKFIAGFFSTLTSVIVVFIFTAFILIDMPKIKNKFFYFIPTEYHAGLIDLANSINRDLNGSIRGQLIICMVNGTLTTIGLLILKVKYAVTIGIIAGVFSIIPIFGTIFSTVPAVLVALTQSWFIALEVLVLILVIHLIEANFLNPKIMGNSVELHPAIIIFSIFVGEHLFGIAGLLLAVPFVAIVRSILIYIYTRYFFQESPKEELILETQISEK